MHRTPEHFQARSLRAKEVESLGGNRGFDHSSAPIPDDVRERIEREVLSLYRTMVDPVSTDEINDEIEAAVREAEIEAEIEAAVDEIQTDEVQGDEIEARIENAVERAVIEAEIDRSLDQI